MTVTPSESWMCTRFTWCSIYILRIFDLFCFLFCLCCAKRQCFHVLGILRKSHYNRRQLQVLRNSARNVSPRILSRILETSYPNVAEDEMVGSYRAPYYKLNSHSAVNLNRWNNLALLFHFCSRWVKKRVGMLVRKVSLELSMWKSHRPIWSTTATMKLNIRPTNKYS